MDEHESQQRRADIQSRSGVSRPVPLGHHCKHKKGLLTMGPLRRRPAAVAIACTE